MDKKRAYYSNVQHKIILSGRGPSFIFDHVIAHLHINEVPLKRVLRVNMCFSGQINWLTV